MPFRHAAGPALLVLLAGLAAPGAAAAQDSAPPSPARKVFSQALPRLDGSRLEATVVEVRYDPGEGSPPHRHPCPVIGYVIEGALRTRSGSQMEEVYHTGESFYEMPDSVHRVSANASSDRPVRFLAYFVCDRQGPLSTPAGSR